MKEHGCSCFVLVLLYFQHALFAQPLTQAQMQERAVQQGQQIQTVPLQNTTKRTADGVDAPFDEEEVFKPERLPLFLTEPDKPGDRIKPKRVWPRKYDTTYLRTAPYLSLVINLEEDFIDSYVLGTPSFFDAARCPSKQCLVLKAKSSGLFSDLTIFTKSGRSYSFFIISDSLNSTYVPDLQVQIGGSLYGESDTQELGEKAGLADGKDYPKSKLAGEMFLAKQVQNLDEYLKAVENLNQRELEAYEDRGILNSSYLIGVNLARITNEHRDALRIFDDNVWTYIRIWPNADGKDRQYNLLQEPIIAEILADGTYVGLGNNYERVKNYIVIKKLFRYGLFLQYSDQTKDSICFLTKDPSVNILTLVQERERTARYERPVGKRK